MTTDSNDNGVNDEKQPLWMPKGSVRAILALAVVGVVMGRVAVGQTIDHETLALVAATLAGYGFMRTRAS